MIAIQRTSLFSDIFLVLRIKSLKMLPLWTLALTGVISSYALNNDNNRCEYACGLGNSLPIFTVAPEEDRGRGIVTCNQELCLLFTEDYDKHSPPRGSKQDPHVPFDHKNHPFQARNVSLPPPAVTRSMKPLKVMLQVTVNTISDFRFDEDYFSTEFTVNMSWTDPGLDICYCHSHRGSSAIEGQRVMIDGLEDQMWLPDIYIWEHISFKRGNSLVG